MVLQKYVLNITNKCNLHCRYCMEQDRMAVDFNTPSEDKLLQIYDAIDKEVSKPEYDDAHQFAITFFGGEPMMVMDKVKEIIARMRLHHQNKIKFRMMTNVSLLTQDLVGYFNKEDVYLAVSYDGPNCMFTKGFDSIKEKHDLLLQVKDLGMNSVLNKYAYPYEVISSAAPFLNEYYKLHNKFANYYFIVMRDWTGQLDDWYDIDYDKWHNEVLSIINSNDPVIKNFTKTTIDALSKPLNLIHGWHHFKIDDNGGKEYTKQDKTLFRSRCTTCNLTQRCFLRPTTQEEGKQQSYINHCKLQHATYDPFYNLIKDNFFIN